MKILVVDDSMFTRKQIIRLINAKFPDYECLTANDADEAIKMLSEHKIDKVTLDFNMPGKTGDFVGDWIADNQPDLPVTFITANIQYSVRERMEAKGFLFIGKQGFENELCDFLSA